MLHVHTQGFNGAPAGNFKIVVSKTETEGTPIIIESTDDGRPAPIDDGTRSFHVVHQKYRSAATTDLTLEVVAGRNAETFDLGPAVRDAIPVFRD